MEVLSKMMISGGGVPFYFFIQLLKLYNVEMNCECKGRSLVVFFSSVWLVPVGICGCVVSEAGVGGILVVNEAGLLWVQPCMEALGGAVPYKVFERKERNGTRVTSEHILEGTFFS